MTTGICLPFNCGAFSPGLVSNVSGGTGWSFSLLSYVPPRPAKKFFISYSPMTVYTRLYGFLFLLFISGSIFSQNNHPKVYFSKNGIVASPENAYSYRQ